MIKMSINYVILVPISELLNVAANSSSIALLPNITVQCEEKTKIKRDILTYLCHDTGMMRHRAI